MAPKSDFIDWLIDSFIWFIYLYIIIIIIYYSSYYDNLYSPYNGRKTE